MKQGGVKVKVIDVRDEEVVEAPEEVKEEEVVEGSDAEATEESGEDGE